MWVQWFRAIRHLVGALKDVPTWMREGHEPEVGHAVGDDFIGVNIATSDDPRCDDRVVDALEDLGVRHVRMNFSYESLNGAAERLLQRVLAAGVDVLLNVLPPPEQAADISHDTGAQARWQAFVAEVCQLYGDRISEMEIGTTPNRGRWSGFDMVSYLRAWELAASVARDAGIAVAGPNVSDFEPLYNRGFLKSIAAIGPPPTIHTNNLFVERVVQPEMYDHRVLGRWVGERYKLNLIKKARVLARISEQVGTAKTYCSYTCWTIKRLARWNADPEQKSADYLVRYMVIAAASGALQRVYWGPLICERDGLMSCGNDAYPKTDNVSFYRAVRGEVEDFRPMQAYAAFRNMAAVLRNVVSVQGYSGENGLHHYVFADSDGDEQHIVWCLDRHWLELKTLYSTDALSQAVCTDAYGRALEHPPHNVTEHPLILRWRKGGVRRPERSALAGLNTLPIRDLSFRPSPERQLLTVNTKDWLGMVSVPNDVLVYAGTDVTERYLPDALEALEIQRFHRDKRNRVWNVRVEGEADELTVKLNRAKGIKKLSYRFEQSKGKRHWNNATDMLRRGVNTPEPVAHFERHSNSGVRDNYFITRYVEGAFSCRDIFTAFMNGDETYRGRSRRQWLEEIAPFVAKLHRRRIVHRDLSSGNLMLVEKDGTLECYLIDIGRARVYEPGRMKDRHRLIDLKRLCYKLAPEDREAFIDIYLGCENAAVPSWWRLSMQAYDAKLRWKKRIKGAAKRNRPTREKS